MKNLDFIYKRQSVRKFKDQNVPMEDIKEMIKAATYAPSGKNVQNWHFVVVKDKEKIQEMAKIIERKHEEVANYTKDEKKREKFMKFLKYFTMFKNAPVLIMVYAGDYPVTALDLLKEGGASSEEIHSLLKPAPGIQNIGAAIENLLLAAANMGYGGCWMTGPNYAKNELAEFIGFEKEGYTLVAITPIGVPDGEIISPPRKPVEEVMTVIE
ncbi:nitroreductase family protein [Tepidibacter formicigenes]|jgi:nitroreductase|uniref:Nitroreductase n=1 Tax=Tepidibacter formicigenes DSM 15518 TaxID=1123349 RepID=A0A1M6KZ20_9FIRM|nr:nitroreductase family protein [Tepidibacter formicigenes]SHJ64124.1 Nitroreductase [Tepidibacter formicigenes DSM 15518]